MANVFELCKYVVVYSHKDSNMLCSMLLGITAAIKLVYTFQTSWSLVYSNKGKCVLTYESATFLDLQGVAFM